MAVRKIRTSEDLILLKPAKVVSDFDERLSILIDDMFETMIESEGIGLAANQVGILKRVIVVGMNGDNHELVNPEILQTSGKQEITEGCLSLPGEYGVTIRPKKVKVKALNRKGEEVIIEKDGLLAAAICHEVDHINGILFKARVVRKTEG